MSKRYHDDEKPQDEQTEQAAEPKTKAEKIAKLHDEHKGDKREDIDDGQRKGFKARVVESLSAHPHVDALFHDDDTVTLLHSHKPDTDPVNLALDADPKEYSDAAEKIAPEDAEALKQRKAVESGKLSGFDPVAADDE